MGDPERPGARIRGYEPDRFWPWYVVPLGAFLVGDSKFGAVIYGTYGMIRALGQR